MKTNENFIKFNRFYVLDNCITRNEPHPKNRFASSRKWRKVETTCYKQKNFCYSCLQRITSFTSTFQLNWCICCACLIFSFRVYFTYMLQSQYQHLKLLENVDAKKKKKGNFFDTCAVDLHFGSQNNNFHKF